MVVAGSYEKLVSDEIFKIQSSSNSNNLILKRFRDGMLWYKICILFALERVQALISDTFETS